MGNVGSTESGRGTNPTRQTGTTRERFIVDPPFDVQAEAASAVQDLRVHTHLHCFNEENVIEPETTPACHDKYQIPFRIGLDRRQLDFYFVAPKRYDPEKLHFFGATLNRVLDIKTYTKHSSFGKHRHVIRQEVANIYNEIFNLMLACGVCSLEQIESLYRKMPGYHSRKLITSHGEPRLSPGTDYNAVAKGTKYIEQQVKKYNPCVGKQIYRDRYECIRHMEKSLREALERRDSTGLIKSRLTQIKAPHLLTVITAAAQRNITILLFSDNPDHWQCAQQLIAALEKVPDAYLGFDLAWLRSQVKGALDARQATLEALPELDAHRRLIKPLALEFSDVLKTGLEMEQGPNATRPYRSTDDADDLLHYAWLLGKIEYFEAAEIIPLLEFVAREAQGEALAHRRGLHDEVSIIADALEQLGSHYEAKVAAIRSWMQTNPFG
jgi:hypothetical protein